jgi:hypothetical protein
MDLETLVKKFHAAVKALASYDLPLPKRIAAAYELNLEFVDPFDLPEVARGPSLGVRSLLTREQDATKATVTTKSAKALDDTDAPRVAQLLVDLYGELVRAYTLEGPPKPAQAVKKPPAKGKMKGNGDGRG